MRWRLICLFVLLFSCAHELSQMEHLSPGLADEPSHQPMICHSQFSFSEGKSTSLWVTLAFRMCLATRLTEILFSFHSITFKGKKMEAFILSLLSQIRLTAQWFFFIIINLFFSEYDFIDWLTFFFFFLPSLKIIPPAPDMTPLDISHKEVRI